MSKVSKTKEQCPFCRKWFIHLNKHECETKKLMKIPNQKDVLGNLTTIRFNELMKDYSEMREPFARVPPKVPEKEGDYIWYPYIINSKGEQAWYFTDKEGTFYITLEQNAIATESNYESDQKLWNRKTTGLHYRKYEDLDRYIFLEGKDKDYFYMNRSDLPPISLKGFEVHLSETSQDRYKGGSKILILTLSGAVKFNFRKRKESALKTADALVERDRDFIKQEKIKFMKEKQKLETQIEKLKSIDIIPPPLFNYQDWKNNIRIDDSKTFVDMDGNPLESKFEVNIGNACWILKRFTGIDLGAYHIDIIQLSYEERKKYLSFFNEKLLRISGWDDIKHFPYNLQPDWGFKLLPKIDLECWGGKTPQYNARRRIKEYIYKEKDRKLVCIEDGKDANFPLLIETLIIKLQLRKRKEFRNKL